MPISMSLSDDIVDIENPDGICPYFYRRCFSGLFLDPSIFTIKDARSA